MIPKAYDFEPQTLGEHILRARLIRGISQKSAAAAMTVRTATLLNWEKGKTAPAQAALPLILAFLGYDPFPAPTSLAERLKAARRGLGWSVAEAARQTGVDPETWKAWEAGETILFRRHREQAARLLDLPLATLHEEMAIRWRRSHAA